MSEYEEPAEEPCAGRRPAGCNLGRSGGVRWGRCRPVAPDPRPVAASFWQSVTLADSLLFVLAILAAIRNLADLGNMPLSASEATNALASWLQWQPAGATAPLLPLSPAYLSLTSPLTQLIGSSDVTMRLVPALVGAALVGLPWLLRRQLGPVGMLVSSALFLTSPTITALARTAGGGGLALFAALLLAISWIRLTLMVTGAGCFAGPPCWGWGWPRRRSSMGCCSPATLAGSYRAVTGFVAEWDRPELSRIEWRQAGVDCPDCLDRRQQHGILWAPATLAAAVTLPGSWLSQFFTGN